MGCYRPLKGYRSRTPSPTGKYPIVFKRSEGKYGSALDIPCGRCIGCRLERSRQWAMRAVHEASLYDRNCFLTLTYRDGDLPPGGALNYDHPVGFMKRLRAKFGPDIRSFGCAEYGEKFARPHYHLCIFNFDFDDKKLFSRNRGHPLFTSDALDALWSLGFATVGSLTFESAAYVARYVTKKLTGSEALEHYPFRYTDSGDLIQLPPERSVCVSRRPGLGRPWLERFGGHSRRHDFIVLRGMKMRPPSYYDRRFEIDDPVQYAKCKEQRKLRASALSVRELPEHLRICVPFGSPVSNAGRLRVKERCHELQFKQLKRGYEHV